MPRDIARPVIRGLPEALPADEVVLWQGRPHWWALARESLCLRMVMGYFILLAAWRFFSVADQIGPGRAAAISSPFLIMGASVCALLSLIAFIQARATVYTITNRRVAMKIGAALVLTLNLPFARLANARLDLRRHGTGTIALELTGPTRLSYLVCWPHVRPWKMNPTQPALRCVPDAERIARLLAETAEARVNLPVVERRAPAPAAVAAE